MIDVFGEVFQNAFLRVFIQIDSRRLVIDFCGQQETLAELYITKAEAELCITEALACLEATSTKVQCDG